jgi:protocatechuate 3,4-dioxygenase beta subunit
MRERVIIAIVLTLLISTNAFGQSGSIKGTIIDTKSGETLIGATVLIKGTTKGTITDFDGNYSLDNLEPGTYSIVVSYVAYDTENHDDITVTAGKITELNLQLEESTTALKEVKVVGKASRESEAMLLMEQKKATVIRESIGVKQLSNMGVSDAASATTKISGVSKQKVPEIFMLEDWGTDIYQLQ